LLIIIEVENVSMLDLFLEMFDGGQHKILQNIAFGDNRDHHHWKL